MAWNTFGPVMHHSRCVVIKHAVRYVRYCPIADKMLQCRECPLSADFVAEVI
jgi:hypothetical protein